MLYLEDNFRKQGKSKFYRIGVRLCCATNNQNVVEHSYMTQIYVGVVNSMVIIRYGFIFSYGYLLLWLTLNEDTP